MRADAISTAVFALGPDEGLALLERLPGVDGVIAAKRQHKRDELDIRITSGLRGILTFPAAG
jgi:thiamine biosynthesis lipoprotein ApbE